MVYLFLGNGFEEIEALTQVDYLRRAGISITTVGLNGKKITGGHGISVEADIEIEKLSDIDDAELVILPGGLGGVAELKKSEHVMKWVQKAFAEGKTVAAICAAPTALAELSILNGKKAIGYPGTEPVLEKGGAIITDTNVVIDGNLITAKAAGVSDQFAFTLIERLKGTDAAEKVKKSICTPVERKEA